MPKKHPDTLGYNKEIGKRVKELTRAGVPVKTIFSDIQHYTNAPGSLTSFYKYYRTDMEGARASITKEIADKVINTAINGDEESAFTHKSRELFLTRVGGWNNKEIVETRELGTEEEENEGAVNALLAALGKGTDDEDE